MEKKPAKRWEGIVDKAIAAFVGAVVTALAAGILYLLSVAA